MNEERALDAAVLALVEASETSSLRDQLRAAIQEYERVEQRCPACDGSGELVVEHGTVFEDDGFGRAAQSAVQPGAKITCVTCGGHGIDPERVSWVCVASYGCRPEHQRDERHEACGWALRPRKD
jgi:hypothetical protein